MKFIVEVESQNLKDRNRVQTSYEYVYDYFCTHRKNFNVTNSDNSTTLAQGITYGDAVFRKGRELHLRIRVSALEDIMNAGGFSQYKNYVPEWDKKGYIRGDAGRHTTASKKLGRYYRFIYKIEDIFSDEDLNPQQNNSSVATSQEKLDDSKEIAQLFSDDDLEATHEKQ